MGAFDAATKYTYILHQGGEVEVGTRLYLINLMFRHAASRLVHSTDGSLIIKLSVFAVFDGGSGPVQGLVCISCMYGHTCCILGWSGFCAPLWCWLGLRSSDPHWDNVPTAGPWLKVWYTYNEQLISCCKCASEASLKQRRASDVVL